MRAVSRSLVPAAPLVIASLGAGFGTSGCDGHEEASTSGSDAATATATTGATASATAIASGAASPDAKVRQIFATRCASCHGPSGKGDGPIAPSLTPHPRDYSEAAWQKATTDDAIAAVISRGGAAVQKSPMMPPSPDLAADPVALAAMVKLVRSFGAP
jgi:cytochrome c553